MGEAGPAPPRAFGFAGCTLDLARAALLGPGGEDLGLRPKAFDVLRHLVENAGRVVGRDELLEAVWPGVHVGEEGVTQCVREIRRALGDGGQRLVRTVPRRGYMLDAEVAPDLPPSSERPPREPEVRAGATPAPEPSPAAARPSRRPLAWAVWATPLVLLGAMVLWRPGAAPPPSAMPVPPVPPAASPTPRGEAERLLNQGRAVGCPEQPCPRQWLAARALYERAIAEDPDYAPAYAEAAVTYTNFVTSGLSLNEAEDRRAAERLATRAAALAPDQAFAHRARAAVLRLDPDRLEQALAAYLRVLSIEPNQPVARANAGWMLVLLGRPAEAEPFLRAALAVAPEHVYAPAWLTYLGLAELFLGREGHGATHFRRALAVQSPGAAAADAGLQRGLNLAAALALDGEVEQARLVAGELRRQHPAVSTKTLWNCDCSREPRFVAGLDKLRRGVVLAGVPDTR